MTVLFDYACHRKTRRVMCHIARRGDDSDVKCANQALRIVRFLTTNCGDGCRNFTSLPVSRDEILFYRVTVEISGAHRDKAHYRWFDAAVNKDHRYDEARAILAHETKLMFGGLREAYAAAQLVESEVAQ